MDKTEQATKNGTLDSLRAKEHLELDGDSKTQRQDRQIFSRALVYVSIAMVLIMLGAYLFARFGKVPGNPVRPDKHPSSELVQPAQQWLA